MRTYWRSGFFAVVAAVIAVMAIPSQALADCLDPYNGVTYCAFEGGCGHDQETYFAQVQTQGQPCKWVTTIRGDPNYGKANCSPIYSTQGIKGNISTQGAPSLGSNAQHVLEWLADQEHFADCPNAAPGGPSPFCAVQVGWEDGVSTGCNGQINTNGAADVEVEIYDDTTSPCTIFFYGAAPLNASYDARYSAMVGNLHRYTVYYEVPGSNNIQVLGWGDYNDLLLTAVAALEAHTVTTADYCPTAGNTAQGLWNYHGEPASQSTFANSMNLCNCSGGGCGAW